MMSGYDSDASIPPTRRLAKKVWYPFGTSSHKVMAYSQLCHLSVTDQRFAEQLALSTGIEAEIITDHDTHAADKKKKAHAKIKINPELLNDIMHDDGSSDMCTKKGCQEIVRKILESQSRNKFEREEIQEIIDELNAESSTYDQTSELLDTKLAELGSIGTQLENTCNHLLGQFQKLERVKNELIIEKDGFNAKLMVSETEKQHANREHQEAEKELASTLWRSSKISSSKSSATTSSFDSLTSSQFIIKKSDPRSISSGSSIASTSYNKLARCDIVDYIERPPNLHSLPIFLQDKLDNSSTRSNQSLSFYSSAGSSTLLSKSIRSKHSFGGDKRSKSVNALFLGQQGGGGGRVGSPSSRDNIQAIRSDNPHLHLPADAFRGYTPTGSPTYRQQANKSSSSKFAFFSENNNTDKGGNGDNKSVSSRNSYQTSNNLGSSSSVVSMSSLGMESIASGIASAPEHIPMLPWMALDPVFYSDRARSSHYRGHGDEIGKMRKADRTNMNGRNIKLAGDLLTSKHPGLDMKSLVQ